jgi:tetratricopeptide (TPR) repeat protein
LILLYAVSVCDLSAQIDRREVRKGNREFKKENYKEADIEYRKALVKDSLSMAANYNLAGNLFRQEEFEQASKVLDRIKEVAPSSEYAADYYYNAGDVAIASKDWQAAVDALKQSLLRNPGDLDAKENYIYAKKMLENQQQQQQNQNQQDQNQDQNKDQNQDQNKDQNQDQNKDQNQDQNKDQNQDNQDQNQDQQDQNKDQDQQDQNQNQNQQQQQGQQPKITPQAAQQMLQAIQAKEKETQDKVNKEKAKALNSRQKEKNW